MYKTCPKCAHVRKENETDNPGTCPACGLIFAKYVEASERAAARREAIAGGHVRGNVDTANGRSGNSGQRLLKIFLLLLVLAVALFWLQNKMRHDRRAKSFWPGAVAAAGSGATAVENREFADLFDSDTALSSLASEGHYTIVEVYLDQCAYCRELEAAVVPLGEKRPDIAFVRVHHSGRMHMDVNGSSREEIQKRVELLNARMNSYSLCATPHIEVYGPDRQPLGKDRCGARDGTTFLWNWIATETGVKRHSAPGAFTGI